MVGGRAPSSFPSPPAVNGSFHLVVGRSDRHPSARIGRRGGLQLLSRPQTAAPAHSQPSGWPLRLRGWSIHSGCAPGRLGRMHSGRRALKHRRCFSSRFPLQTPAEAAAAACASPPSQTSGSGFQTLGASGNALALALALAFTRAHVRVLFLADAAGRWCDRLRRHWREWSGQDTGGGRRLHGDHTGSLCGDGGETGREHPSVPS